MDIILTKLYVSNVITFSEYIVLHPIATFLVNKQSDSIVSSYLNIDLCSMNYHDSILAIYTFKSVYKYSLNFWSDYTINSILYKQQKSITISEEKFVEVADGLGSLFGLGIGLAATRGVNAKKYVAAAAAVTSTIARVYYNAERCPVCGINHNIENW